MELDEAPALTSRLDHLAELATSPSHAIVHPPTSSSSTTSSTSSSSNARPSQPTHSQQSAQDDSRNHPHRSTSPSSSYMRDTRASSPAAHHHSRSQAVQQQLEAESSSGWGRSPITPTTTRKFTRMAIHDVLEGHGRQGRNDEGESSPPYKRKGSPEDSFSDPPSHSRSHPSARGGLFSTGADHSPHPHLATQHPRSPRFRHESPMPQSNSDDDEDSDIRNYKKRRMLSSSTAPHNKPPSTSPSVGSPPEVMDQVRSTLKLKQQQKAIIEARQSGASGATSAIATSTGSPSKAKDAPASNGSGQPVTEKTSSGISVFHGSASFAAMNRRPLTSPKNPKNAKSLTIFAPSYSDSSLSIHSAPLQPSHAHQAMSMNPRTSQPIRNHTPHQPHPLSQHQQAQHTGTIPQPLRSPKTAGHAKRSSRVALRTVPHTAGLDTSSGTLPAPILSSHTGPLPSPAMYPIPPTPFHPSSHASLGGPPGHVSKPAFMETVSGLFDSMDSSRSLKHTLEEQIRKSAQLLQTLQSSGTMIESLVRGQFKELEKGVIDRFEGELEYLSTRVRLLEEHQGLTPPPKKARISAVNGATKSTNGSLPSPPSVSSGSKVSGSHGSGSDLKDGTLPTPPFNKNQDSAMEIEDEEPSAASSSSSTPASSSPREQPAEYHSSVKKLQERVADLEKRHETAAQV